MPLQRVHVLPRMVPVPLQRGQIFAASGLPRSPWTISKGFFAILSSLRLVNMRDAYKRGYPFPILDSREVCPFGYAQTFQVRHSGMRKAPPERRGLVR